MNKVVERNAYDLHGTICLNKNDVWMTFEKPYTAILSWIWWWLTPGRWEWIFLNRANGGKVRIRAKRLSTSFIRLG